MEKVLALFDAQAEWILLATLALGILKALVKHLPKLEPLFATSKKAMVAVERIEAIATYIFSVLLLVVAVLVLHAKNAATAWVVLAFLVLLLIAYNIMKRFAKNNQDPTTGQNQPQSEGQQTTSDSTPAEAGSVPAAVPNA